MLNSFASWEAISIIILMLLLLLAAAVALREYLPLRDAQFTAEMAEQDAYKSSEKLRDLEDRRKNGNYLVLPFEIDEAAREFSRAREQADLQRQKVDRLVSNMRTFFALVVLAFVPLVFASIFPKPVSPPVTSTSVTIPVLEELARQGGKDLQALIELLKPRVTVATPDTRAEVVGGTVELTWGGWLTLVLGFAALTGVACMILGKMGAGATMTAGSIFLLALGNVSAFEKGNLFGALFKFEGGHVDLFRGGSPDIRQPIESTIVVNVFPWKAEPVQVVSATNVEFHCDTDAQQLRVSTFVSGEDGKLMDATGDRPKITPDNLRENLAKLYKDKTLVGLLLIGFADKDLPTGNTQRDFDTNHSLAQKRALWVEKELKARPDPDGGTPLAALSTVVVLGAPPKQVDQQVQSEDKEKDRIVRACVAVRSKPQKL